jgi:hypothetical protein
MRCRVPLTEHGTEIFMALSAVDPKWTRKVARQLTSAVSARYGNVTDFRLDRIWQWAMRSRRNLEVTFAAVQMLRDLETIDRAEAAYLFSKLYDRYSWKERDERHEAAGDAILDGVEAELVRAAARAAQRTSPRSSGRFRDTCSSPLPYKAVNQ